MPFNVTTGVYTPPAGATNAATGQVIQSAIWNTIHADLATALTLTEQQVQATFGQRNIIGSNGGMEIWQRGAGGSASIALTASQTLYTVDRWYLATGANQASNVTQVAGIATGSRYAAKIQRNSGQTGVTAYTFGFPLDSDECAAIAGSPVAVSFVAKAGANYSGGSLTCQINVGTGSPVKFSSGSYSGAAVELSLVNGISTSAARFEGASSVIPASTTQAEVTFTWTPTGTAGADDSITLDNVQMEILPSTSGLIAGFETWPFERMLAACKRHFQKTFAYGTAPAQNVGATTNELVGIAGKAGANAGEWLIWRLPVTMRITPGTTTLYNPAATNAQVRDESVSADCSASSVSSSGADTVNVTATGNASTTVGGLLGVHITADAGI